MKQRISLSRLLHNDKLMMIVSFVLAIVVWALVVYGPNNAQERVITGVPVSITLNAYATDTLNLRIIEGENATATVRVNGPRSVVDRLTASDINVTANTADITGAGKYTLNITAQSTGDFEILSVVGTDGSNSTVTITCDAWSEKVFPVTVEMPGLSVTDEESRQFGTPAVSGDGVTSDGRVTVSGPRTDINRIAAVVAVIKDTEIIDETKAYTATLVARDENGEQITSVRFVGAENGEVSVTVPVLIYQRVTLTPTLQHVPADYRSTAGLVTVTPSEVELWGVPSELDEYIADLQNQLIVDFDQLTDKTLTRQITLAASGGVRPVNGSETITVKVALSQIGSKTLEVPLSDANFTVIGCPDGYRVTLSQSRISGVVLCGNSRTLRQIDADDVIVTLDLGGSVTTGKQTLKARVAVRDRGGIWAYYGEDSHGIDVLVTVEQTGTGSGG